LKRLLLHGSFKVEHRELYKTLKQFFSGKLASSVSSSEVEAFIFVLILTSKPYTIATNKIIF